MIEIYIQNDKKEMELLIPPCIVTGCNLESIGVDEDLSPGSSKLEVTFFGKSNFRPSWMKTEFDRIINKLLELQKEHKIKKALVIENKQIIFSGAYTNSFSYNLNFPYDGCKLTLFDSSVLFDFQALNGFNPYVKNPKPLFIYSSSNPELSIFHLLVKEFKLDFFLPFFDTKETTMLFVIEENENVLSSIKKLLKEFCYTFFFSNLGIFKLQKISSFVNAKEFKKLTCLTEQNLENRDFNYSNLLVSFSNALYKSGKGLLTERKAVATKYPGDVDKHLLELQPEELFPWDWNENPQYNSIGSGFLETNLKFSYLSLKWFGYNRENKDLGIVATFNWQTNPNFMKIDPGVDYFLKTKMLSYSIAFKNTTKETKKVYRYDLFSDVIYRNKKNTLKLKEEVGSDQLEEFLNYVHEKGDALEYFNLKQSFLKFGTVIFSFSSTLDFDVFELVEFEDKDLKIKFSGFIISKNVNFFESDTNNMSVKNYTFLNFKEIGTFKYEEHGEETEEKKPIILPPLTLADKYQKLSAVDFETDYFNDNYVFSSLENVLASTRAKIILKANSIFFLEKDLSFLEDFELVAEDNVTVYKPASYDFDFKFAKIHDLLYEEIETSLSSEVCKSKLENIVSKYRL